MTPSVGQIITACVVRREMRGQESIGIRSVRPHQSTGVCVSVSERWMRERETESLTSSAT